MKTKTQKRKEALKRREADLAYWQARQKPADRKIVPAPDQETEKKIAIAERDILALRIKLGQ